jgi:hypothetical protein
LIGKTSRLPNFDLQPKPRTLLSAAIFNNYPTPVSHDPTRKSFLAKLIGLVAVAGLAPRLVTKAATTPPAAKPTAPSIHLRPDSRAVARRADSV